MAGELSIDVIEETSSLRSAIHASTVCVPPKERTSRREEIKRFAGRQREYVKSQRPGVAKDAIALEAEVRTIAEWKLDIDVSRAKDLLKVLGLEPLPSAANGEAPVLVRPAAVLEKEQAAALKVAAVEKRLEDSKLAWERFQVTAGRSDSPEDWLSWAVRAAAQAHEPGCPEPLWQKVTEPPPDLVAIPFALQAYETPAKVLDKLLAIKQGGGDDGMIRACRKQESELLRMLDEVDAEIAAKGKLAYA